VATECYDKGNFNSAMAVIGKNTIYRCRNNVFYSIIVENFSDMAKIEKKLTKPAKSVVNFHSRLLRKREGLIV